MRWLTVAAGLVSARLFSVLGHRPSSVVVPRNVGSTSDVAFVLPSHGSKAVPFLWPSFGSSDAPSAGAAVAAAALRSEVNNSL